MGHFIIEGGRPLKGAITIQGSKNATLPILAATLLTNQECVITNAPRIADVERLLELMTSIGVKVKRLADGTLKIKADRLLLEKIDQAAVGRFRASVLCIGALLARQEVVTLAAPGGCQIGARSLDTHLNALKDLGVQIKPQELVLGEGAQATRMRAYAFDRRKVRAGRVTLGELSVTATENVLLLAASLPGLTELHMAALEPHAQELCEVLKIMGADISGLGTHTLYIKGRAKLSGFKHRISPDMLEAGTFLVAAAVTRGELTLQNIIPGHNQSTFHLARQMGVNLIYDEQRPIYEEQPLTVRGQARYLAGRIQAMPYPGFPTDLQAPFGVLATQATGASFIHDPLYEGRLKYLEELGKMGANTFIADPHRAIVFGPTELVGQDIQTFDIRAGATLLIAGLAAKGRTILRNSYQLDRGYERIDTRLNAVGANITRLA